MAVTGKEYERMTQAASPPTGLLRNLLCAFGTGGAVCALGEGLEMLYTALGVAQETRKLLVPCSLILLSALLTALGVYDKLASVAGAGLLVPITGFANAVVSPAMEFSSEGRILGTGAQMFRIAGPVLAYGTAAAALYGVIYELIVR
ncbi:MAG: SpoVA/SpoVAEb family sporulation membrane protein [Clostridia bacterium]|nr:SpoVA/SpoVAEb family sporulation membrane protein [Clostridia bacterium]